MPATYPKRPPFFALRFLRVVLKSCAGQVIGAEGVCLLLAVAQVEDSKRYTDAPTFWNEQLVPLACCRNWAALDRARKRCVEAGWLHYEAGGKSKVGRYWVKIPPHLEVLDDAPLGVNPGDLLDAVDDGSVRESRPPTGLVEEIDEESGRQTGGKREVNGREAEKETGGKRDESSEHSILSPIPIPVPVSEREPTAADRYYLTTPTPDDVPRETKNDTVVITPGRDIAIPSADPVHGLGVWVRWRTNDRSRQDENVATIRSLVTTHGAIVVQRAAERLQRAGSPDRDRKPGDKCWPDELLPEILRDQAATAATATPAPEPAEDLPPIVRQARALVELHGDDAARSALGWTPANAPTRRSILEAANRLAVAQELVDHLAALPPPDGNPAARSA